MGGFVGPVTSDRAGPTPDAQRIVGRVTATLGGVTVPDALVQSLTRYVDDLLQLATSLIAAGLDETAIEAAIDGVFRSYRKELARAITVLGEQIR